MKTFLTCLLSLLNFVNSCTRSSKLLTDIPITSLEQEWKIFKIHHAKNYSSLSEEASRKNIFEQNLKIIRQHNEEYKEGIHSYYMGVTFFSDITHKEFLSIYLGVYEKDKPGPKGQNTTRSSKNVVIGIYDIYEKFWITAGKLFSNLIGVSNSKKDLSVPSSIDWRQKGYVTEVKNQRTCGSCWAFSAVGAIEGSYYKSTGKLLSLSAQQLVDCSLRNMGCGGGFVQLAFSYIKGIGGIATEASYPYIGDNYLQECNFNKSIIEARIKLFKRVSPLGSGDALAKAVAKNGPVSVSIDASGFQHYLGGIFYKKNCKQYWLNHVVVVVGYKPDYWIVKNSWGTQWGDDGYIYMARNRKSNCGILDDPWYVTTY